MKKCIQTFLIGSALAALTLASACKKKEGPQGPQGPVGPAGSSAHYLGEKFGGGMVCHVYKGLDGNEHGLIVSLADISDGVVWGPESVDIVNSESNWDGATNTKNIILAGGHPAEAAGLCANFRGGDKTDWFLPAVDQINLLESVSYTVNKILSEDGLPETTPLIFGDVNSYYWSSTEISASTAAGFKFVAAIAPKSKLWRVRAMREF